MMRRIILPPPPAENAAADRKSMGKLFLKLWLLILLTSITSYKIQDAVFDYVYRQQMASVSNERVRRVYAYIEELLSTVPKDQWQERFARMQKRVGSPKDFMGPSRLATLDELSLTGEALEEVRAHRPYVRSLPGGGGTEIFHTILGTEYVVVLEVPIVQSPPMYGVLTPQQFTWIVESLLYACAVGLWLTLFWRDMKKLDRAAGEVGQGHFGFSLNIRRGAALWPLADSFNKMKDRIGALLSSHRNLTNAISHEFRTPITRLRFRHELAINAKTLAEKDQELMLMNSAIDQLDDLSTELLEYARLDRETPALDIGPIDTVAWLNELADEAREVARAAGRDIDIRVHTDVEYADGDYRYLTRAAANLLRNAVRYARRRIDLTFEKHDGQFTLLVDDDGPGIPVAEREHLFEPFTRLDKSRDRQSGGFGIGLAIVKQIARWHGGAAAITDSALGGTRVSLTW